MSRDERAPLLQRWSDEEEDVRPVQSNLPSRARENQLTLPRLSHSRTTRKKTPDHGRDGENSQMSP